MLYIDKRFKVAFEYLLKWVHLKIMRSLLGMMAYYMSVSMLQLAVILLTMLRMTFHHNMFLSLLGICKNSCLSRSGCGYQGCSYRWSRLHYFGRFKIELQILSALSVAQYCNYYF